MNVPIESFVAAPLRNGEVDRAQRGGGGARSMLLRPEVMIARRLRREMSPPEVRLWQRLRGAPAGLRFRRQHPVGRYVVDFYCARAALAIEVDGKVHGAAEAVERDGSRQAEIEAVGVRMLRVAAAEVMADVDRVASAIVAFASGPLHHAAHGPPPRTGEEKE